MEKIDLIFDTDAGSDCDDIMAMAYLLYAKRNLNINIKAVTHCLSTTYGVPAMRSFFRYFKEEIPEVGKMVGGATLKDGYCKEMAEKFAAKEDYEEAPDAAKVLRRALATSETKCVICAVGQFTNIAALMESTADEISPLNGVELVKEKCSKFTIMAGKFKEDETGTRTADWNIKWDVPATKTFFELSPVPIVILPSETGKPVITGEDAVKKYGDSNPLTQSFLVWHGGEISGRHSWDPMTAIYAVEGTREFFNESEKGNVSLTDEGVTYFEPCNEGKFTILTLKSNDVIPTIEKYIDDCAESILNNG